MATSNQQPNQVIVRTQKSMAASILLALFFGPLGMLYSTVMGAIVMMIVTPIVALLTVGLGLFVTQPICVIWAVIATNTFNKKLFSGETV